MAKNTQEAEVIVTLNGEPAKRVLNELEKEYKDLEKAALDAYKAGDDALGKKLDKQAQKVRKSFEVAKVEAKKFDEVIKNINAASLNDLRRVSQQLQNEIKKLAPGTQEFIDKSKQLQQVNSRIATLKQGFKGVVEEEKRATLSLKGLSEGFNRYFGIVSTGVAAITGLSLAFRKAAQAAAELDDRYADVMKTTGLTHEQVESLDKELMKIDTRTSRDQLLLLARDAGKLGITGQQNILGFVRAADQIQVALGEDLGEGAIKQLGKIADVLGYTKSMGVEQSLLSIGSAINAVGQDSTASEAYLVEFVQRLAGVGAQANISAADLIGFASGLDQSAMKVEMAATAFQKFLMKLYEDPKQFASYARMEVQEFTDLLKNDANKAITTVLKALQDQDGFASLVPIFKDMGLDGARAVSVLASMASNLGAITDAQALANAEFEKATSVTDEYSVKNNNLQAQLEKARKEFQNATITLGQSLNPVLLKSTKGLTYLIKLLAEHGKEIGNAIIAVAALTTVVKLHTIVQGIANGAVKVYNTLRATATVLTNAAKLAYAKLTGATIAATAAQNALNAAMSKSVFGLMAIVVGSLAFAITNYTKKMESANEEMEHTNELEKELATAGREEEREIRDLQEILNNENLSLEERNKALLKLKEIVPDYHASLSQEGKLINDNTEALDKYISKSKIAARTNLLKNKSFEIDDELFDLDNKYKEYLKKKEELERDGIPSRVEDTHSDLYRIIWGYDYGWKPNNEQFKVSENAFRHNFGGFEILTPEDLGFKRSEYGEVMAFLEAYKNETEKLIQRKKEIDDEIIKIYKEGLSDEDREIFEIKERHESLKKDILQNYQEPTEAQLKIKILDESMQEEIQAVKEKYAKIKTITNDAASEQNEYLTQAEFTYLQERYRKLTKKEKELVDKGYAALDEEDSQTLKDRYDRFVEADKRLADKRYNDAVKAIDNQQRAEQNQAKREYIAGEISAEQYEKRLLDIKYKYLQEKLALAEKEGKDTSAIEQQILDQQIGENKAEYDRRLKVLETEYKNSENTLKEYRAQRKLSEEEFESQMLALKMHYLEEKLDLVRSSGLDETTATQAILDAQIEAQEAANKRLDKLREDAQAVKDKLDPQSAQAQEIQIQLDHLEELHEAKLLSEQEYEEAVAQLEQEYAEKNLQMKLQKAQDYIQKSQSFLNAASNFSSALQSMETAQLEAEYQARLTAAGDNAEEREAIEAEYEQKKLDTQKKYADVDMVINIAKTIAAGALAAVQAFAQLGPIAGAVMAAVIAGTTAAEVATIIAQRNAIKNASVSGGGGGGSTPNTGTRTVTGYSDGGYTDNAASDNKPVGVVHANEWVAPAWMVREDPVRFADLEHYRRTKQHSRVRGSGSGFAEGGYTGGGANQNTIVIDTKGMQQAVANAVGDAIRSTPVRSYVVRNDIKELDEQDARFKKQTSR